MSEGFSGRDIREVCLIAESKWGAYLIRNNKPPTCPPFEYYLDALKKRQNTVKKEFY